MTKVEMKELSYLLDKHIVCGLNKHELAYMKELLIKANNEFKEMV